MPIPDQIVDSVAIANTKAVAEGAAFYSNLAMANSVQHQNLTQQNALAEQSAMGVARLAAVKNLIEADPAQAMAVNKMMTGNDVASQMQALLAALNSGQQGAKSAQSTPPETGKV
jgi:hypothetical protein